MIARKLSILMVIPFILVHLSGCIGDHFMSDQRVELVDQSQVGNDLRMIMLNSDRHYFEDKQREVRPALEVMINSGEYNIVSIDTKYSSGYLTSATVTYNASKKGLGNDLRVTFVHSGRYYWRDKSAEIKPQLDRLISSGAYGVVKVNTVQSDGYILAAELYHREMK